jgi:hypothetical protein
VPDSYDEYKTTTKVYFSLAPRAFDRVKKGSERIASARGSTFVQYVYKAAATGALAMSWPLWL